jgi:TrmH family RNA methyltransferase
MYTVVFVEPESSGNIGSLARVMKNFGLRELVLVNPKCKTDQETKSRAKHAFDIIERARIVKDFGKIGEFDFVIGTTGKITPDYDEVRCAISPKELAEQVKTKAKIALVFGREGIGLKNEELSLCDIVVHIPTDYKYPVLNVSHAAAIVFYELFSTKKELVRKADKREKEVLFDYFDEIVDSLAGIRDKKKVAKVFRNVVNRSLIAGKEAHTLAGVLKELKD